MSGLVQLSMLVGGSNGTQCNMMTMLDTIINKLYDMNERNYLTIKNDIIRYIIQSRIQLDQSQRPISDPVGVTNTQGGKRIFKLVVHRNKPVFDEIKNPIYLDGYNQLMRRSSESVSLSKMPTFPLKYDMELVRYLSHDKRSDEIYLHNTMTNTFSLLVVEDHYDGIPLVKQYDTSFYELLYPPFHVNETPDVRVRALNIFPKEYREAANILDSYGKMTIPTEVR